MKLEGVRQRRRLSSTNGRDTCVTGRDWELDASVDILNLKNRPHHVRLLDHIVENTMLKTTGDCGVTGNHSKSTIGPQSKPSVSQCLLRSYYPVVMTRQHYLAEILESGRQAGTFLTHETDTSVYRTLLKGSYVARPSSLTQPYFKFVQPMVALQEVRKVIIREL